MTLVPDELVGATVGPWRVVERIGVGGLGSVYRAVDAASARTEIALKVFTREGGGAEDVAAIVHEAMVSAVVRHPHVAACLSCGDADGRLYLAMELLEGGDSKRLTTERRRLEIDDCLRLAEQVAQGLGAVHRAGLIHRDVKPSNVLLDRAGNARLADLGLVFPVRKLSDGDLIVGTPAFMSPEQARGERLDHTCDFWSLGSTIFYWATGTQPYIGRDTIETIERVAKGPVPDPADRVAIEPRLAALIRRLMEPDPARRYADADEVLAAIRAVRAGGMPPTPRAALRSAPAVGRNGGHGALLASLAAGALGVVALVLLLRPDASAAGAERALHAPPAAAWTGSHQARWIGDPLLTFAEVGTVRYERAGGRALFDGQGASLVANGAPIARSLVAGGDFSVEVHLEPGDLLQQGPARVVGLSLNHRLCNFMIGQSGTRLEVRCRTSATNPDGTRPHLVTQEGALRGGRQHVVFVRRGQRNELWIDGREACSAEVPGSLGVWDAELPLVIGDEHRGGYAWHGAIDRLAFHTRALEAGEIAGRAAEPTPAGDADAGR